jgi:hypothetical protein
MLKPDEKRRITHSDALDRRDARTAASSGQEDYTTIQKNSAPSSAHLLEAQEARVREIASENERDAARR